MAQGWFPVELYNNGTECFLFLFRMTLKDLNRNISNQTRNVRISSQFHDQQCHKSQIVPTEVKHCVDHSQLLKEDHLADCRPTISTTTIPGIFQSGWEWRLKFNAYLPRWVNGTYRRRQCKEINPVVQASPNGGHQSGSGPCWWRDSAESMACSKVRKTVVLKMNGQGNLCSFFQHSSKPVCLICYKNIVLINAAMWNATMKQGTALLRKVIPWSPSWEHAK